jgi:hypothetical protein
MLSNGQPIAISGGIGSTFAETYSGGGAGGEPPPFSERKKGEALFLRGDYLGTVFLWDDSPAANEEGLDAAMAAIAKTISSKL